MKALLFSDLHCNNKQLQNLYDFIIQNKSINMLVFAGDVVNMGEPVWFMEKFIKVIDELKKPFLWVPGNNDFGRAYHKLNARYKSLEGRVAELPSTCHPERSEGSIRFTGVGGSPASWAGQYQGENMIDKKEIGGSIFVSHWPPPSSIILKKFDVGNPKLETRMPKTNSNVKSSNVSRINELENSDLFRTSNIRISDLPKDRRFSDAPLVHICGHLHYRWGTAFVGQTKIIQLASLETGHYAILDLETLAVKFERF